MSVKPFEQIVAEHGQTVLRVCRAVLGPDEADDAWSETFLSAMRGYPDLDRGRSVEAWLVTIAKRKAIDQHRGRQRRPIPVERLPETPTARGQPGSRDHELWEALAALPRKQREAVAYHHIAGLPYAEVAEILGNTEAAARRAAADGMRKLRATYGTTKGRHR